MIYIVVIVVAIVAFLMGAVICAWFVESKTHTHRYEDSDRITTVVITGSGANTDVNIQVKKEQK
jgi:flagellar basal body-associated protein FliL